MSSSAFVTLLTTDSYLPGALVLLHSLQELHPAPRDFKIVALVTPETVDAKSIGKLRKAGYDLVIGVEPIGSGKPGQQGLELMGRPDLNLALTKLHLFRLGSLFSTIIYLDADVLPLRPLSHLFTSTAPHALSACPDTGWPDCFNSGVMVIRPRESDWLGLKGLLKSGEGDQGIYEASGGNGSFDGADQGLLNEWFSEEGGGGEWNRLSFTYNVTPTAAYTYAPAYRRFGHKINAVHFIGPNKPWASLKYRPRGTPNLDLENPSYDYPRLVDRWYLIYDRYVRTQPALASEGQTFAVPEHVAVWNRSGVPAQPDDRLDLDELKAAAQKGLAAFGASGQYISMPLDGRVDLLMPKPRAKKVSFKDSTPSAATAPGSPMMPTGSSAPGTAGSEPSASTSPPHIVAPLPQSYEQQMQQPKTWDAAHYPPPSHGEPEMKIPMDTRYAPAWERPTSEQSAYHTQSQSRSEPQYPTLPSSVRNDEWYKEYTHSAPDRSNVRAVFPWEQQGQQQAQRVFPRGSTPPPQNTHRHGMPSVSVQEASPATSPRPEGSRATPQPAQPPRSMAEAMASYKNAWDSDPRIGQYVDRMTGGSRPRHRHSSSDFGLADPKSLQSMPGTPNKIPSTWIDSRARSDASEDGDDEDDGDDEPDIGSSPPSVGRSEVNEIKGIPFAIPDGPGFYKSNAKYRDRHAQTEKPALRDATVQANPGGPISPAISTHRLPSNSGPGPGGRRLNRSQASSSSDTPKPQSTLITPSTSQSQSVTPQRRPFPVHNSSSTGSSSRYINQSQSPPLAYSPQFPDPSTTNPNLPQTTTRVFDPSTDVDMRKRDSQQVLTRFMQAGTFGQPSGSSNGNGNGSSSRPA